MSWHSRVGFTDSSGRTRAGGLRAEVAYRIVGNEGDKNMNRPSTWRNFAVVLLLQAFIVFGDGKAQGQEYQIAQPDNVDSPAVVEVTPYGKLIGPSEVARSNAYPNGDYYTQLASAGGTGGPGGPGACSTCGPGGGRYGAGGPCKEHWGCGGSPFRTGPGQCDDWRVGPIWQVTLDGVFMTRDETNIDALAAAIGTTTGAADSYQQFEHGTGTRLTLTGWWPQMKGYEMQVGYLGIFNWDANVVVPDANVVAPPVGSVALTEQRDLKYGSDLHSLEINAQRLTTSPWKPFFGVRFLRGDEKIQDITRRSNTLPLSLGEVAITNNLFSNAEVENNLIGFQLGMRRDVWHLSEKLSIHGFSNGGAYCNMIDRDLSSGQTQTRTELIAVDDPATPDFDETGSTEILTTGTGTRVKSNRTELSFVGEVSLSLQYKLNQCSALRGGYQVLYINGLEFADDAYLGLAPNSRDLLLHGWFAGFEYRR